MSWRLYRWVWLVESPLAVGAPPAGSLNRCRLYVPARTLWGALTAERARATVGAERPKYKEVGETLARDTRLTYLFPAEPDGDRWMTWLPRHEEGRGLVWRREDDVSDIEDRAFRRRLMTSRANTAINPRSNAADEGSLRETECVADRWRDSGARVAMVGYVFLAPGTDFWAAPNLVIQLGGDTRYVLGRLRLIEPLEESNVWGRRTVPVGSGSPSVCSRTVLAHADATDGVAEEPRGALELLAGWDRGQLQALDSGRPLWAPGSSWAQELDWEIASNGIWKLQQSHNPSECGCVVALKG